MQFQILNREEKKLMQALDLTEKEYAYYNGMRPPTFWEKITYYFKGFIVEKRKKYGGRLKGTPNLRKKSDERFNAALEKELPEFIYLLIQQMPLDKKESLFTEVLDYLVEVKNE